MFTDTKVILVFSKNKLIKLNLSFAGDFLTINTKAEATMGQSPL